MVLASAQSTAPKVDILVLAQAVDDSPGAHALGSNGSGGFTSPRPVSKALKITWLLLPDGDEEQAR